MGLHPYQCNPEQFARVEGDLGPIERGGQTVVLFQLWGFAVSARYEGRQAPVSGSRVILESRLQLFHVWKSRLSAYDRRIYGFTSVFEGSSR
ncbi:hypothetical protein Gotur_027295 [Gossypium turneri]